MKSEILKSERKHIGIQNTTNSGERREFRIVTRLLARYQRNCGSLPYRSKKFASSPICSKKSSYLMCMGAVSRGIKQPDLEAKHHRRPELRINGAIPPLPYTFTTKTATALPFNCNTVPFAQCSV
jgi:hypothetical protein